MGPESLARKLFLLELSPKEGVSEEFGVLSSVCRFCCSDYLYLFFGESHFMLLVLMLGSYCYTGNALLERRRVL